MMEETDRIRIHAQSNGVANTLDLVRGGHKVIADDVLPVYKVLADLQDSVTEKVQILSDMTEENRELEAKVQNQDEVLDKVTETINDGIKETKDLHRQLSEANSLAEARQKLNDNQRTRIQAQDVTIQNQADVLNDQSGEIQDLKNQVKIRTDEKDLAVEALEKSKKDLKQWKRMQGDVQGKLMDLRQAIIDKELAVVVKDIPKKSLDTMKVLKNSFMEWLEVTGDEDDQS